MPQAIATLEQAVQLEPAFARAYARLSVVLAIATIYRPTDSERLHAAARRAAQQAIDRDPTLAEPHAALGRIFGAQRQYIEERRETAQALALDPNDANTAFWHATSLVEVGYTRAGEAALDRVLEIDPLLPNALGWRGMAHLSAGDFAQAERRLQLARDV